MPWSLWTLNASLCMICMASSISQHVLTGLNRMGDVKGSIEMCLRWQGALEYKLDSLNHFGVTVFSLVHTSSIDYPLLSYTTKPHMKLSLIHI